MRLFTLLVSLVLALPLWAKTVSDAQLLQLVDYVGVDYEEAVDKHGKISNEAEYREMQEFSATILSTIEAMPENGHKAGLILQAKELVDLVEMKVPVPAVREQTKTIAAVLYQVVKVKMAPSVDPNPVNGKHIYAQQCISCHGEHGGGDGPLAASLDPAPTNFLDPHRMALLTPFALYNTITLGVEGTAMVSYEQQLSDQERWDLAYYIHGLLGEKLDLAADPFTITFAHLANSIEAYEKHNPKLAYQEALAAYLDGFETAEAALDILDHEQRISMEKEMMAYRSAIENNEPVGQVRSMYDALVVSLTQVQQKMPTAEFTSTAVFFSALVILLREGLESILIVGMLIVMLIKGEKRDLLPAVHAGWLVALVAGALTWWGSHTLITISGAMRELTEGVTALVAAGMLLYVGIWIHRNQLAHDWRAYIKEKLSTHVANEARWGLGFLAFLAVYRELFETVLFYEALGLQVGPQGVNMIWLGIGIGLTILLAVVFFMIRFGLSLPIQAFFRVSTWLIFLFAIVFIGQGIHGLEEAGSVPYWPVPVPRIDILGIYPNLFGLMFQALVLAMALYMGCRSKK